MWWARRLGISWQGWQVVGKSWSWNLSASGCYLPTCTAPWQPGAEEALRLQEAARGTCCNQGTEPFLFAVPSVPSTDKASVPAGQAGNI